MTKGVAGMLWVPGVALLLMAAANGAWLKDVPAIDRAQVNPVTGQADAVAAGGRLYQDNCSKCHGADGMGHASRPAVRSARVAAASDGELFWLLKNGEPFRGMPAWARLPEGERWQIIAYLRSIQAPAAGAATPTAPSR